MLAILNESKEQEWCQKKEANIKIFRQSLLLDLCGNNIPRVMLVYDHF